MPRWASRILLEITGVRVERLREISIPDVAAEGFALAGKYPKNNLFHYWDLINAKRGYGWDTNPWVWVIEFKILEV